MITLSQPSTYERTHSTKEAQHPSEVVETAGSLAMLYHDGLMTMGQYDEFISSNPFAVDYSMYANSDFENDSVAYGGFLSDFANGIASLGEGGGFVSAGFAGDCGCSCGGFCGGFSSVC